MGFESIPSGEPDPNIEHIRNWLAEDEKKLKAENLRSGDVVQVGGETEPYEVLEIQPDKSGALIAKVRNMATHVEDFKTIGENTGDIIRKIEGAQPKDNEHFIAGNIRAQEANDQIEEWKDKK